ncbi:MAG: sodium-dependent bicarbonate transport family permease [Aureispira sp.]
MNIHTILENFSHAPVLFFFLGVIAVLVKSDLDIPPAISKFLGIYLLFDIGIKGGEHLYESGFTLQVITVILVCTLASFCFPFITYLILKRKFSNADAGSVAAAYGSISAVTFATATSFLETQQVGFGGYMVAGMALMESPAIIAGLIIINMNKKEAGVESKGLHYGHIIKEAFFNGSVFLLIGSMLIGYLVGNSGKDELTPFVSDIFVGMLSLYMLDMGLVAARRMKELKNNVGFALIFGLIFPGIAGAVSIGICYVLDYSIGDALLQTVLLASASYIAVPAAMRLAVPEANMSIMLPMTLGITFTFNIAIGIPSYYFAIQSIW